MNDANLIGRATRAYHRYVGTDQPCCGLSYVLRDPAGRDTVVLANINGVLAYYGYPRDQDRLRRLEDQGDIEYRRRQVFRAVADLTVRE